MNLTTEQLIVFATLLASLGLFLTGWWRYDLVALAALMVLALTGVVKPRAVFAGFSDSAVISVAAVFVMSRGLRNSGVVEVLAERLSALSERLNDSLTIGLLGTVVAFLSAFINDVGTLALFMPVGIRLSRKQGAHTGRILMPLAYATLLGGMTTLVGAPVNLVISAYRAKVSHVHFGMFDFTPVGVAIAAAGLFFIAALGWRLLPARGGDGGASGELFKVEDYETELRVPEKSKGVGKTIAELGAAVDGEVNVLSFLRNGLREVVPQGFQRIYPNDLLVVSGRSESLEAFIAETGFELESQRKAREEKAEEAHKNGEKAETQERNEQGHDEIQTMEAVVMPNAWIVGRTARELRLRNRYAVNLLAVARRTAPLRERLRNLRLQAGDVLLTQGGATALREAFADLGCVPLASREIRLGHPRRTVLGLAVFASALALAALDLLSVPVALIAGAVAMVILGLVRLDDAYASLEGPVLVLIGGMLTVAETLQTVSGSALIARPLLWLAHSLPPAGTVALIYVATMLLSNVTNYVATAVVMAPIAIEVAAGLQASVDPLLMAVAFGSVSAFLTPIGHPSNTLVMGPGGYKFSDYTRMGLPVSLLTTAVASLLIPLVWPFKIHQ
jgi:di/tricarboxylate transporter